MHHSKVLCKYLVHDFDFQLTQLNLQIRLRFLKETHASKPVWVNSDIAFHTWLLHFKPWTRLMIQWIQQYKLNWQFKLDLQRPTGWALTEAYGYFIRISICAAHCNHFSLMWTMAETKLPNLSDSAKVTVI